MAEQEEYKPEWSGKEVSAGTYIWTVFINDCLFREQNKDGEKKPYMQIEAVVVPPTKDAVEPMAGTEFGFRVYMNPKAKGWCVYFLKKFGYDEALMKDAQKPIIRRNAVAGLYGKVLVNVTTDDQGMLRYDVKGFDHVGGDDLEKKLAKTNGGGPAEAALSGGGIDAPEQVIDLQADVQGTPNMDSEPDAIEDL